MDTSVNIYRVPSKMQVRFDEISDITDTFADKYLDREYKELCKKMTAALCRKRPSPLEKGKSISWACGIVHAIGRVNYLFDSSQKIHMKAKDLYAKFGVHSGTGSGKSKQVLEVLKISPMDPKWTLPSKIKDNPMVWMISIDGYIVDSRQLHPEDQKILVNNGIIPSIPEQGTKNQLVHQIL